MLKVNFLHCTFLVKKITSFNKIQSWFFYLVLVKKVKFFFIITLQRFNCTLSKVVKSRVSFIFKFKIPSKTIFNLIVLEIVNLVKCLNLIKHFNFSSFCKKQIKFSLLRSPFVFKKSQDQLLFDIYTGSFLISWPKNNFLVSEYIEFFILKNLKRFYLLDIIIFKNLKTG